LKSKDAKGALVEIETFLSKDITPEVRSSALGMKGDIQADLGDVESARETLLAARALAGSGFGKGSAYGKYVHELSLAETYVKENRLHEAISWYRSALQTCLQAKFPVEEP
jgi:predicted negative regulator of RcsB-dependent stress response